MDTKKLLTLIPIIGGILALIGTYVPLTMIISGSFPLVSMELWLTPLGEITGDLWYSNLLGFCRLKSLADLSSQAMIPIVIGYIITGISVAAIALGAMQLILEDNKIVIITLILGIALIVLVIIQHIVFGSLPSALSDILNAILLLNLSGVSLLGSYAYAAFMLSSGVATSAAGGFYYILIGGILVLLVELFLMLQMRSETA